MRLRNKVTGVEFVTDDRPGSRSEYRFNRVCKGLDRFARDRGLALYFLTLTLGDDQADAVNRDLHSFLTFLAVRFRRGGGLVDGRISARRANDMRDGVSADGADWRGVLQPSTRSELALSAIDEREGLPWAYVWAVELQKRRYLKRGVLALHWHFAIACQEGCLPDVEFRPDKRPHYRIKREGELVTVRELWSRWGRGHVFCMRAYSSGVYGYLSKYFAKDYEALEGYKPEWATLRRFGSSQLGHYAYPEWANGAVAGSQGVLGADLWRVREGGKVRWYGQEVTEPVPGVQVSKRIPVLCVQSPWQVVDGLTFNRQGEGFGEDTD